ncbi:MAG: hypothetical protein NZ519_05105 [Bacteroidia bacterium]|nr:hypothetical protein [Bacteroidia bacterium]
MIFLSKHKKKIERLESAIREKDRQIADLELQIQKLSRELAAAPKVLPPNSPIEFVTKDKFGNNYYTFKSEEQITVWRAEGIFRTINNSSLSVSDTDLIEHEQIQCELFTKLAVCRPDEKTELQRQYFQNSARLQERIRNCGEYQFLLALTKLVMVCENEPLEYAQSAAWDAIKEERLKNDPTLLGFFLPKAAILNEQLKNYQNTEQMGLLVQLVTHALKSQTNTPMQDTTI